MAAQNQPKKASDQKITGTQMPSDKKSNFNSDKTDRSNTSSSKPSTGSSRTDDIDLDDEQE